MFRVPCIWGPREDYFANRQTVMDAAHHRTHTSCVHVRWVATQNVNYFQIKFIPKVKFILVLCVVRCPAQSVSLCRCFFRSSGVFYLHTLFFRSAECWALIRRMQIVVWMKCEEKKKPKWTTLYVCLCTTFSTQLLSRLGQQQLIQI